MSMMDLKLIRRLLRDNSSVILLEEGHAPLVVRQLRTEEPPEEVPIASRWPKGVLRTAVRSSGGVPRSVFDGRRGEQQAKNDSGEEQAPVPQEGPVRQDQILERLNKEILALKEQIAQEEAEAGNH